MIVNFFIFFLDCRLISLGLFWFIQQHKKITCTNANEGGILISITTLLHISYLNFMSHEFLAPETVGTESRTKLGSIHLGETLSMYEGIAKKRYEEAIRIAENIDDRMQTSIPMNRNAVYAASLLMVACVRGAQVS